MTLITELRVTGIDIDAALTADANWSDVPTRPPSWNSGTVALAPTVHYGHGGMKCCHFKSAHKSIKTCQTCRTDSQT